MKILSLKSKQVYDITVIRPGENLMPCPECSYDRTKSKNKSFSWNQTKGVGKCHHCDADFVEYKPMERKKKYKIPEWKNRTDLSDQAAKWFHDRGITAETLNKLNVSSAREFMPQTGKDESTICFPYIRDGKVVNIKYRDERKNFKLATGAELILYNLDSIIDKKECVIVEGEIDALSFIQVGISNVVSVPNGAGGTSMEFLDNAYERLIGIERFYLAVDNDPAGHKLREELIRRLGAERCSTITFDDCKDANEYLLKHGGYDLANILSTAKQVPVEGVITQSDIYNNIYHLYQDGLQPGLQIGIPSIDQMVTWEPGRVCVVTGIPGHGKSEIMDYIVIMLNLHHGWKVAYYSPENYPLELHYAKIASKITGKSFASKFLSHMEFERSFSYINENFFFIYPEEDTTVEGILSKAKFLVRRYGVRIIVIDPYNKLDHSRDRGESETEYISRFLDRLSMFSKQNDCLVILVAHPRKMDRKKDDNTKYEIPTLYDINGSANFYNKCDYGLIVYRDFAEKNMKLIVSKVKFKHLGDGGEAVFDYNDINGRISESGKPHDYTSYIDSNQQAEQQVIELQTNECPF